MKREAGETCAGKHRRKVQNAPERAPKKGEEEPPEVVVLGDDLWEEPFSVRPIMTKTDREVLTLSEGKIYVGEANSTKSGSAGEDEEEWGPWKRYKQWKVKRC